MTTAPESGNADLLAPVAPGLSAGAFADRVLGAALGTLEMYAVYFGWAGTARWPSRAR